MYKTWQLKGTGAGKTMIAMTLIHKLSAAAFRLEPPKQTVFLVPSIVLAVQQAETLRNNLPFTICVAYGTTVNVENREQLKKANIVVATHGAYMNLLQHYGFRISSCNLLILDECHHCVGSSIYSQIMESYRRENAIDRPRVVGLTASPLLSVKLTHSDAQIDEMLDAIEKSMDSSIIAVGHPDASIDVNHVDYKRLIRYAREHEVFYGGNFEGKFHERMPPLENLNARRTKDFAFYVEALHTLGPLPLKLLASSYLRSMSPYSYDKETEEEYSNAQKFLTNCIDLCEQLQQQTNQPLASKLRILALLLQQEFTKDPQAIGVVFVERRLTALAINLYFDDLRKQQDVQQSISEASLQPSRQATANADYVSQFMDADESLDPIKTHLIENERVVANESLVRSYYLVRSGQRYNKISDSGVARDDVDEILKKFRSGIINCLICTSVAEEGMDIQTCSFAVAFDGISSSRRYIQMKGRVRHEEGKFFLLRRHPFASADNSVSTMKLSDLAEIDSRVTNAILRRVPPEQASATSYESPSEMDSQHNPIVGSDDFLIEKQVVSDGVYHAR
jgi:ERCC4-related helicase